ncbi:hypothetical protein [Marinobacter nauticus]|uniref:Uncharacterized protein n=1 Tax=Marinobacter nauticus (strain ATCC 700491 / DSM 11845 / VT8) TaxID=351348 RepID=A1U7R5_MARN8|nr:hypothetical protein [Marinobacter nauticus]ABM21034.1 hypothetical protein Maqu_4183 [Marinobacter nauticus VT8]
MPLVRNVAISAVLLANLSLNPANAADDNLNAWVTACNLQESVTIRAGEVSAVELRKGMITLNRFGHLESISALPTNESCLSFLASGHMDMPVIVMFAGMSVEAKRRHPTVVARLRRHYEREHHADRLTQANILLYPAMGTGADSPETIRHINRGVLAGARDHQGAYAATTGTVCTISIPEMPFAEQSQLEQPYAWSMLGKNDREYLKRNSDSIVFWHEVAHCNTDQSAEYLATQGKGDQQLTDWNENQEQARQACADPGLLEQWSSTMESRRLTATRPEDLATGEIDPTAMNQMIHFELLKESVADQVGTLISQKRREKRIAGCASKTYVSHPWYRYRLASSVREPDARYMTWISPWLSNLPEPSIHQVLRDSHRGLMLEAKDSLPKPLWMELNHSRSSRPDQHRITDPAGPADSSRASAWKAWISEQLDRSKGEIDLGKN